MPTVPPLNTANLVRGIPLDNLDSPVLLKVVQRQLYQQRLLEGNTYDVMDNHLVGQYYVNRQGGHQNSNENNNNRGRSRGRAAADSGVDRFYANPTNTHQYIEQLQPDLPRAFGVDEATGLLYSYDSQSGSTSISPAASASAFYGTPQAYEKPFRSLEAHAARYSRTRDGVQSSCVSSCLSSSNVSGSDYSVLFEASPPSIKKDRARSRSKNAVPRKSQVSIISASSTPCVPPLSSEQLNGSGTRMENVTFYSPPHTTRERENRAERPLAGPGTTRGGPARELRVRGRREVREPTRS